MTEHGLEVAKLVVETVQRTPAWLLVFTVYIFWVFGKITDRKHYYTARFMAHSETELKKMRKTTVARVRELYKIDTTKGTTCSVCHHPIATYELALTLSIKEILHTLKMARHRNGYHHRNEAWVKVYCKRLSQEILIESRETIRLYAPELNTFLIKTETERYSDDEAYKLTLRLINEDIALKKMEKSDIRGIILFYNQIFSFLNGEQK